MTGTGFTFTVTTVEEEHPVAVVPVRVYAVEEVGHTLTKLPVRFPGIHV
jgi:hypothetical protein